MGVQFTKDVEKAGYKKLPKRNTWEYFRSESLVEAVHFARDMGWGEKKVQVKAVRTGEDVFEYYVEPYEEGCGCKGLLKYDDFFVPGSFE